LGKFGKSVSRQNEYLEVAAWARLQSKGDSDCAVRTHWIAQYREGNMSIVNVLLKQIWPLKTRLTVRAIRHKHCAYWRVCSMHA